MTDESILKKVILILRISTNYSISIISSMYYLLGNKLDETDFPSAESETTIQDIASGKRTPSQTFLNYFAASDDWSLSRLSSFCNPNRDLTTSESERLVTSISALYAEYFPRSPLNNFNNQIKALMRLHFFGTADTAIFPKYTQTTVDNYVPWSEKNNKLRENLKKSNIVFVSGFPGMGKKQLVRHYLDYALSHGSYLPYNIAWLDVTSSDSSLKAAFSKSFNFLGNDLTDLNKKCDLLKQKATPAVVIINCPFLKKEDFSFIDHFLKPTKVKYITKPVQCPLLFDKSQTQGRSFSCHN